MTTYGTFDIDTVPAPSDEELRSLDYRRTRYGFNGATKLLNINSDRERFHTWFGTYFNLDIAYDEDTWRTCYETFCAAEDAADLLNTQADALV